MAKSQERRQKYQVASEIIQELYASPESGEMLQKVYEKYQLSEKNYSIYSLLIGDIVLGFYPKSQLPLLLQQNLSIPQDTAGQIAASLADFLKPIPEMTESTSTQPRVSNTPTEAEPSFRPQEPTVVTSPTPQQTVPSVITPKTVSTNLSGSRTMQDDIASIQRSGQNDQQQTSDVPRYAKPLTEMPRYDAGSEKK